MPASSSVVRKFVSWWILDVGFVMVVNFSRGLSFVWGGCFGEVRLCH